MKIGERGQVTLPKALRVRFGLQPGTEVEFETVKGNIVLRKRPKKMKLKKWQGRCKDSLTELGYKSVNEFIEGIRGR